MSFEHALSPPRPMTRFAPRIAAAAGLAALADGLFYGHEVGFSLAIFLSALALTVFAFNKPQGAPNHLWLGFALLAAGQIAIVEHLNVLSFCFGILGFCACLSIYAAPEDAPWSACARAFVIAPFSGPLFLARDAKESAIGRALSQGAWKGYDWTGWVIPLVLTAMFLSLFAIANPLMEIGLKIVPIHRLLDLFSSPRPYFWLLVFVMIWPVFHARIKDAAPTPAAEAPAPPQSADLLSANVILRSLALFNVLFAAQTLMDLTFLWGGFRLPHGMTLAAYAHRGAYPLMATAILAAVFVIAATAQKDLKNSRIAKPLLILFVAQNLFLVLSSILRLDLYVAVYSLTYWRAAAFIWMGLVAAGLALILAQVIWSKSVAWLLRVNAIALAAALYACCFVNFPYWIGSYNLAHCKEITGEGYPLDFGYFENLGPYALPALDDYASRFPASETPRVQFLRNFMFPKKPRTSTDWRSWSFAQWRLDRYLDAAAQQDAARQQSAPQGNAPQGNALQ